MVYTYILYIYNPTDLYILKVNPPKQCPNFDQNKGASPHLGSHGMIYLSLVPSKKNVDPWNLWKLNWTVERFDLNKIEGCTGRPVKSPKSTVGLGVFFIWENDFFADQFLGVICFFLFWAVENMAHKQELL